ncbi:meiotic nuclear division protein 1 homolog isoform X1 [Actinidia eriantha]|uniref:meiotic nuclear division protein 1 homolog isoform X1 n=1 Tax=Actinidia eriantha TaxID=165200 RepID=UPI0025862F69|nr:meiotic nuclear division protein 1 homolog isoform X1 [Actinidia eriantha]
MRCKEKLRLYEDEMGQYADNDPAAFEAMKKAIEVAHAAANRWTGLPPKAYLCCPSFSGVKRIILYFVFVALFWKNSDNIFTLRQWCSNNFPQAKEQLEHLYNEDGDHQS